MPSEADFLGIADQIRTQDHAVSPITAALIAAISLGIAADSRTFAKLFDIEHALVLRDINHLSGPDVPIEITRRDGRTQRTHLQLTVKGQALMARALDLHQGIAI